MARSLERPCHVRTCSGRCFDIRRAMNGLLRILFIDGRSLSTIIIRHTCRTCQRDGNELMSNRGSRLSIDATNIRKSPLYLMGIGLNAPLIQEKRRTHRSVCRTR
jgi:hypothetical protein